MIDYPKPSTPQPTEYLNYAKKADAPRPDTSTGSLFESAGRLLTGGVKVADTAVKEKIKDDAFDAVNTARDEENLALRSANETVQGFGDPRGILPGTSVAESARDAARGRELPPSASSSMRTVEGLNAAFKQRKVSDAYYWMRLDSIAKNMRNRYPGYREEVDAAIAGIAGTTPANALRQAELRDLNSFLSKTDGEGSKLRAYNLQHMHEVEPGIAKNWQEGKITDNAMSAYIQEARYNETVMTRNAKRLEIEDKEGTADKKRKIKTISEDLSMVVSSSMTNNKLVAAKGLGFETWEKALDFYTSDKAQGLDSKQKAAAVASLTSYQANMRANLQARVNKNYANLGLSKAEMSERVDNAMAPIDTLIENITKGDWGAVKFDENFNKLKENASTKRLLEDAGIESAAQMRKLFGDNWLNMGLFSTDQAGKLALRIGQIIAANGMTSTSAPVKSVGDMVKDGAKAGVSGPGLMELTKDGVETYLAGLLSSKADPESKARAVRALYGDGNENFLMQTFGSKRTQLEFYNRLTDPSVYAEIKKTGDASLMQNYVTWTVRNGQALVRDAAANLNTEMKRGNFNISFSPVTNQIEGAATAQNRLNPQDSNQRLQAFIGPINRVLAKITPIVKDQEGDLLASYADFFTGLGVDVSGKVKYAPGGRDQLVEAATNLWQVIKDGLAPEGADDVLKRKEGSVLGNPKQGEKVDNADLITSPRPTDNLLATINKAESGAAGYNSFFGVKGGLENLTSMTIDEVLAYQKRHVSLGSPSSAAGNFQIIQKTLQGLKKELGLTGKEVFNEATQNRLFEALLDRRGRKEFMEGKITAARFADNLAMEWAGLPLASGRSFYHGDGLNKANVSRSEVLKSLRAMKDSGGGTNPLIAGGDPVVPDSENFGDIGAYKEQDLAFSGARRQKKPGVPLPRPRPEDGGFVPREVAQDVYEFPSEYVGPEWSKYITPGAATVSFLDGLQQAIEFGNRRRPAAVQAGRDPLEKEKKRRNTEADAAKFKEFLEKSRRSPLVYAGLKPDRIIRMIPKEGEENRYLQTQGTYSRDISTPEKREKTETLYMDNRMTHALMHEGVHRTMQLIDEKDPKFLSTLVKTKDFFKTNIVEKMKAFGVDDPQVTNFIMRNTAEELLIRGFIAKTYGTSESITPATDKNPPRDLDREGTLLGKVVSELYPDIIERMEERADLLIADGMRPALNEVGKKVDEETKGMDKK